MRSWEHNPPSTVYLSLYNSYLGNTTRLLQYIFTVYLSLSLYDSYLGNTARSDGSTAPSTNTSFSIRCSSSLKYPARYKRVADLSNMI